MSRFVSIASIRNAAERIAPVARCTPVVPLRLPGEPRWLAKCENLQLAGAFKFRGAYNTIAQLSDEERRLGVVTYSSGNHGQGVALAAKLMGAPAVIVMPTSAPAIKVEGARGYGAEVLFEGTTSLQRKARAEEEAARRRLTVIHPFDDERIIAGQGTVGLEIVDQCPGVTRVLVPVGGGGLISGVAAAVKQLAPGVRVIGVEPVGSAAMRASLEAGHPVTLEKTSSVADGLLPVRPGDLTFAHVQQFVDEVVTVEDAEIVEAVRWFFARGKLVVEPSGAATLAALLAGRLPEDPDGTSVAVASGGNISLETLQALA